MRRILTELDRQNIRRALWKDVKALPAPRKVRLLYLERLYNEWLENFRREEREHATAELSDVLRHAMAFGSGAEGAEGTEAPGGDDRPGDRRSGD